MSPQTWIAIATAIGAFVLAVMFVKTHWIWSVCCAALFILSIALIVHFQNVQTREEKGDDALFQGELVPDSKYSVIPNVCKGTPDIASAAVVALGNSQGAFLTADGSMVAFQHGRSELRFEKHDDSPILLTLMLYDADGHLVVAITNNMFRIDGNRVLRDLVRRLPDQPDGTEVTDLKVYDMENRPLLHIEFRNNLNVYLTGSFSSPGRQPLTINDDVLGTWQNRKTVNLPSGCTGDSPFGLVL
jgi:hypothetical protein